MKTRFVPWMAAMLVAGGSLAFAGGLIPGKWKIPDGGKVVKQRPAGATHAFILNNGPDRVIASSKGKVSVSYVIMPDGNTVGFQLPAGAKNVKITDSLAGNGLKANGILLWGKKGKKSDKKGGIGKL